MCGRYSFDPNDKRAKQTLDAVALFQRAWAKAKKFGGHDCRPMSEQAVFFGDDGAIDLVGTKWGWQVSFKKGPLINARFEKVDVKKTFYEAVKKRRCVVPATAYYEWRRDENDKPLAKHAFRHADGSLLLMAGLWQEIEGTNERRFLVLTREMGKYKAIHDRTPVLLTPAAAEVWLDHKADDGELAEASTSCTDDDLIVRSVESGPTKAKPAGEHLMVPLDAPWPWN